jgi:hypothetical protein
MSDVAFEKAFNALADRLGRSIQVPSRDRWRIDDGQHPAVVVTMPGSALALNMQSDAAAVPSFAFCLAFWFERFELLGARQVRARVEVEGDIAPGQHTNRSLFLLHELESLLGDRFTYLPKMQVPWPRQPCVNSGNTARQAPVLATESSSERDLEIAFTTQSQLVDQFAVIEQITEFKRQLPVGIFDGQVSKATRWSPGGKSQIDLWALAADWGTVHLFELKSADNINVGMLPEALWYARLLHRIRVGDFGGVRVEGGGGNMDVLRGAKRIRMWLLAPSVHPLLLDKKRSPLEWLNAGLAGSGLDFGILPFDEGSLLRLRPEDLWDESVSERPGV